MRIASYRFQWQYQYQKSKDKNQKTNLNHKLKMRNSTLLFLLSFICCNNATVEETPLKEYATSHIQALKYCKENKFNEDYYYLLDLSIHPGKNRLPKLGVIFSPSLKTNSALSYSFSSLKKLAYSVKSLGSSGIIFWANNSSNSFRASSFFFQSHKSERLFVLSSDEFWINFGYFIEFRYRF